MFMVGVLNLVGGQGVMLVTGCQGIRGCHSFSFLFLLFKWIDFENCKEFGSLRVFVARYFFVTCDRKQNGINSYFS